MDIKLQAVIYVLIMGLQGFMVKLCSEHLNYKTNIMMIWGTCFLILAVTTFKGADFSFSRWHFIAIVPGILAAVGTILLYQMIATAELTTIFPILRMNVLVIVVLGMVFLGESMTIKKLLGIGIGFASIHLLLS